MNYRSIQQSWTLAFLRKWHAYLSLPSIWSLRRCKLAQVHSSDGRQTLSLRMKGKYAGALHIRARGSDVDTLDAVIGLEVYGFLTQSVPDAEFIVDLGANIGLATRYFCAQFRRAKVYAVEPDPENFELLTRNTAQL